MSHPPPYPPSPNTIKLDICCFFAKQASLMNQSKNYLVRDDDNVTEWSDMFTCQLLFQWTNIIKTQLRWSSEQQTSFHCNVACSCHYMAKKKKCSIGVKQLSLTHWTRYGQFNNTLMFCCVQNSYKNVFDSLSFSFFTGCGG